MTKEHFNDHELRCRGCPAGDFCKEDGIFLNVDPVARHMLNELREKLDKPLLIDSASRCPSHNLRVGGKPASKHLATPELTSTAFDISCNPRRYAFYNLEAPTIREVVQAAIEVGFNGIGTYEDAEFVHVDKRPNKAHWMG